CQVTQRDSFHLCQTSIPVALQPITTSASIQRGQNMLYFRPGYGLFHTQFTHNLRGAAMRNVTRLKMGYYYFRRVKASNFVLFFPILTRLP
ncbi:MAG TPA: hypothetical protein VFE22_04085, partial [Edaphobacter sp.]|nr:hypothetical protein [Edaphobacter sp.]